MPNQFETCNSDIGITIHLKMNGERLENQMALGRVLLTIFDFSFVYLAYEAYINKNDLTFFGLILLLAFFIYLLYLHYDHRQRKRWIMHADETFLISKNSLSISKRCLNQNLLTIDIDTQKITEISYNPWIGGAYPPYLPDYSQGNIHLHTSNGYHSFGINFDKEEAEEFMTHLRSLIMEYQEPRHFIFASHLHLKNTKST